MSLFKQILRHDERTAVFIDGANLYSSARGLEFSIDYKVLLEHFQKNTKLIRAFYYTAILDDDKYSALRPLVDWLDYNGYYIVKKDAKTFTDSVTGRTRIKGNMDIELAIDMLEMAPHIEHAVLFSGDGDFRRLVEAVQRHGVRVTAISTTHTQPPMASDDLRRQCDMFVELKSLMPEIYRVPLEREEEE